MRFGACETSGKVGKIFSEEMQNARCIGRLFQVCGNIARAYLLHILALGVERLKGLGEHAHVPELDDAWCAGASGEWGGDEKRVLDSEYIARKMASTEERRKHRASKKILETLGTK
jgi:hypothetical protein